METEGLLNPDRSRTVINDSLVGKCKLLEVLRRSANSEASELYARPPATGASPYFGRGLVLMDPLKMFFIWVNRTQMTIFCLDDKRV